MLVDKATKISARQIAVITAGNVAEISVYKKPKVAILSTGDELLEVGSEIGPDKIVNSNVPLFIALVEENGGIPINLGTARDTLADLKAKITHLKDVDIFVTALLSVWQDLHKDPTIIRRETNPDGPIGQLPPEILAELDGFYTDAVAGGLYDPNGGGRKAANADMEWYSAAGQLEGNASDLNIEDFWYLAPLDKASQ